MSVLDLFKLDGKVALVTGSRRGIGRAMAEALAEAGADIIGVSAQMEGDESEVGQAIRARGRKFTGLACDFSDRNAIYELVKTVNERFPVAASATDLSARACRSAPALPCCRCPAPSN